MNVKTRLDCTNTVQRGQIQTAGSFAGTDAMHLPAPLDVGG